MILIFSHWHKFAEEDQKVVKCGKTKEGKPSIFKEVEKQRRARVVNFSSLGAAEGKCKE